MLFSGESGHRLEPVTEVRAGVFHGPGFYSLCNRFGHTCVEGFVPVDGGLQLFVDARRKTLTHLIEPEGMCAVPGGDWQGSAVTVGRAIERAR